MKKILFAVPLLLATTIVFAQAPEKKAPAANDKRAAQMEQRKADMDSKFSARREEMKKEKAEVDAIVERYNKASTDKEKAAVRKELRDKVAARTDEGLKMKEARLKDLKDNVSKAEKSLKDQQKNKNKFVDEMTDAMLKGDKDFMKKQHEGFGPKGPMGPGPQMKGPKCEGEEKCAKGPKGAPGRDFKANTDEK